MTSTRRNVLIAAVAGLAVAGGVTAIAATQFHGSHKAKVVAVAPAVQQGGNGGGFNGQPGLGGSRGFDGQPRLGGGYRGGGFFGGFSTAATYLGVTLEKLQTEMAAGKTLAQIAKDNGKSVDGLVSAMVAAGKKQLDAAVSSGQLTKEQEDAIVSALTERSTAMVNGTRPTGRGFGGGFGPGYGGGNRLGPDDDGGFGPDDGGGGFGGNGSGGGTGSFGGSTAPA